MAMETERIRIAGELPSPSLLLLNRVGYDFNDKMNLELKHELHINKPGQSSYGLPILF